MIANRAMAERARGLAARVPRLKHLIVEGPAGDGALEYEPLLAAASPALERRPTGPDEICMQPYTSGSTGKPKGVLLAHGGQIWNADVAAQGALGRRHGARARRRAALPQERDGRRGEAVPPRGRLAW